MYPVIISVMRTFLQTRFIRVVIVKKQKKKNSKYVRNELRMGNRVRCPLKTTFFYFVFSLIDYFLFVDIKSRLHFVIAGGPLLWVRNATDNFVRGHVF